MCIIKLVIATGERRKAQETDATPDQTNRATGNVAIMADQNVTAEAEDERKNRVPFEIRKRQHPNWSLKVKLNATFRN